MAVNYVRMQPFFFLFFFFYFLCTADESERIGRPFSFFPPFSSKGKETVQETVYLFSFFFTFPLISFKSRD